MTTTRRKPDVVDTVTLGAAEIELWTDGERAAYLEAMEQVLGPTWSLSPKQLYADAVWEKCDWLLYGGSAGPGKSEFALNHANRVALEHPGSHQLLIRQTIPELRRSLIVRMIARIAQFGIPAKYRKVDGMVSFQYDNGSIIECGHCRTDEDVARYLSSEYQRIIVDEATLNSESQILQLQARLRTTRDKAAAGLVPKLGLFTNPGGQSHAWLYDMVVTPTAYGRKIIVVDVSQGFEKAWTIREYEAPIDPRMATTAEIYDVLLPWVQNLEIERDPMTTLVLGFVPAKASDNPHIDPTYLRNLNALPERRRRQLRDGDWDVFEGQYFDTYVRSVHVIEPFPIPRSWQRARGIDFGTTAPYGCFDDQTEILTENGWCLFGDLQRGVKVATVEMTSKQLQWQEPSHYTARRHCGDLIVSEPSREGVNFAVTPDHRMVTYDSRNGDWKISRADSMRSSWMIPKCSERESTERSEVIEIPHGRSVAALPPVDAGAFARFLGLFIAEGSLHKRSIRIGQKKYVDRVREIIAATGWRWTEFIHASGATYFTIHSADLHDWMVAHGLNVKSQHKRIPRVAFAWGAHAELLDGLMVGDGSVARIRADGAAESSDRFHTSSPGLADDVQELALRMGCHAFVKKLPLSAAGRFSGCPMYTVWIQRARGARVGALPIERRPYDGMVYCVTVPNSTIVVRRHGRPMVSGNCLWAAWDEDGNCYIYRETYAALMTPAEQARQIVTASVGVDERGDEFKEEFAATVADPSVFADRRGMGKSIADMWREAGLTVARAKNQRVAGWANVRQYMWDSEKVGVDGAVGGPRLFIFNTCTNLTRTLPLMRHDDTNPEDLNTKDEDHLADCLRYVLMVRPASVRHYRSNDKPIGLQERVNDMMRRAAEGRLRSRKGAPA